MKKIKKSYLYWTLGILLIVFAIEYYWIVGLSGLQSGFSSWYNRGMGITQTAFSLDSSSPSGDHTSSTSDTVLVFQASGPRGIPSGTEFQVYFLTDDGDINEDFWWTECNPCDAGTVGGTGDTEDDSVYYEIGPEIYIRQDGINIVEGIVYPLDDNSATEVMTLDSRINSGTFDELFYLKVDTMSLLEEDTDEDDPLYIHLTIEFPNGASQVLETTLIY